jgi:uncharacterized protein (DUF4415 family)
MSKSLNKHAIQIPSVSEDRQITAAARSDPDAQPLTPTQLGRMTPMKARGRPPSADRKQLVSVRYSPEVLVYFRATGEGWQARMDGVLKRYVDNQMRRKPGSAV